MGPFSSSQSASVIITLALQYVRGNLVQFLKVSVHGSTIWSQVHCLPINRFNNTALRTEKVSRMAKEEVKNQEGLKKRKDQKGLHILTKEGQKARGRPCQKEKVNGPLGHGIRIRNAINKVIKKVTKEWIRKGKVKCQVCGKSGHNAQQCRWNQSGSQQPQQGYSQTQDQSSRQARNISGFRRINPFRLHSQINSEVFRIFVQLS